MRDVPIEDPPAEDLGPAMLELTLQQRRFVVGWIRSGGRSAGRVARAAGYSDSGGASRVKAFYLLRNPKVMAALREEAERNLNGPMVAAAIVRLGGLTGDKDAKVRQTAIDSILDRVGYGRKSTQDIRVEHVDTRSTAEILAAVQKMFGPAAAAPQIVDATFEEVAVET